MTKVEGMDITTTRGDTVYLEINLKRQDGGTYIPQEGDTIRFALKRRITDLEPLIIKDVDMSTLTLRIESEETKALAEDNPTRISFVYDIELTQKNGDVCTPIMGRFIITSEVH